MSRVSVGVTFREEEGQRPLLPRYCSSQASGADVHAFLTQPTSLAAGKRGKVPTGLFFDIPLGFELQVRPRSGLALKHDIIIPNAPGTIDSDYRGELFILLANLGHLPFVIEPNMRIAQLVIAPVLQATFTFQEELSVTERGSGGFGHTGLY